MYATETCTQYGFRAEIHLTLFKETKGEFWRMCPRAGFCAVVPVFVPSLQLVCTVVLFFVPSFRFSVQGNIRQNHPFGNPAFCEPPIFEEVTLSCGIVLHARLSYAQSLEAIAAGLKSSVVDEVSLPAKL